MQGEAILALIVLAALSIVFYIAIIAYGVAYGLSM